MKSFLTTLCFLIFAMDLMGNSIKIDNKIYDDETVAQLITVITSTHPIPSIPDTSFLYEAQKSLSQIPAFAKCKKIIVFDGVAPHRRELSQRYEEYKYNIRTLTQSDPYFSNTELVFCNKWVFLSGALEEAIKHVTTPYVFIFQHDLVLLKEFDLNSVIAAMDQNKDIKYVCLYDPEHASYDSNDYVDFQCVSLIKHYHFTDRTHIARTEYYKNFILPLCPHTFMEFKISPDFLKEYTKNYAEEERHKIFGMYRYDDEELVNHTFGSPSHWNGGWYNN